MVAPPSGSVPPSRFETLLSVASAGASGGGAIRPSSPLTGTPLFSLPLSSQDDISDAVRAAREAVRQWRDVPMDQRIEAVTRFASLVDEHRETIMDIIQIETGKSRRDALEEVLDVLVTSSYFAARAAGELADAHVHGALPFVSSARIERVPHGIVGLITPWNYPFTLVATDAVPALLAGNAVLVKPSELTTLSALMVAFLLRSAGVPAPIIQVVTGGADAGSQVAHSCDFIQFTGSTDAGRKVGEVAGGRLTPCSLELGGKNPMIVFGDVPLDQAVAGAMKGCFANAGQLCVAAERLFVHRSIYPRFRDHFVAATSLLRLGTGPSFENDVGSLVSADQLKKVTEHVDDAREHGATILCGGASRNDIGPYFYAPTILEDVSPAARMYSQETFGPVVALYPFDSEEEVIAMANDTPYGLHASVWSSDLGRANSVAGELDFGTVAINDAYLGMWGSTAVPMGGMKDSGIGRRHGREGLLKYTQSRSVVTQRLHPLAPVPFLSGSAFAGTVDFVARIRKLLSY